MKTERVVAAFGTVDHHIHRQRRSAVKTFVSKKTVLTFQSSICTTVELLCRELNRYAKGGEVFECSTYFLSWATDSVAKYLENDTYGLLDDHERRKNWQDTIGKVVELTPVVKQFPLFMPFVLKVPGWVMEIVSPEMNLILLMHKVRDVPSDFPLPQRQVPICCQYCSQSEVSGYTRSG